MTEYDHELWLVVGNANNWGRGTSFNEAIGHAIKSAGMSHPMTQAHVYRLNSHTELKGSDLWCDDFGNVSYTLKDANGGDTHLQKLPRWNVPKKLNDAYFAFDIEVEEVRYGKAFDAVFDI